MSQAQNSFARLQAAGVVSDSSTSDSLRPVLDGLTEAEVDLLIRIGEKAAAAGSEVESHQLPPGGETIF